MSLICICKITENRKLSESLFSISFTCPEISRSAHAGQFVSVRCGDERILRRPLSICKNIDDSVTLVYEVKGEGTKWLSNRVTGDKLDVFGPLGKGYTIPNGNIFVVGGGIGVPPLLYAAMSARGDVSAILGFRSRDKVILENKFKLVCNTVLVATDDGSYGVHGSVIDPLRSELSNNKYAAVLACGPKVMLKAVADLCSQYDTLCQMSLEERMGCGVGACMVCACATISDDGVSTMSRVCKDGPVFPAQRIAWVSK